VAAVVPQLSPAERAAEVRADIREAAERTASLSANAERFASERRERDERQRQHHAEVFDRVAKVLGAGLDLDLDEDALPDGDGDGDGDGNGNGSSNGNGSIVAKASSSPRRDRQALADALPPDVRQAWQEAEDRREREAAASSKRLAALREEKELSAQRARLARSVRVCVRGMSLGAFFFFFASALSCV
jgi:hypothetical protein